MYIVKFIRYSHEAEVSTVVVATTVDLFNLLVVIQDHGSITEYEVIDNDGSKIVDFHEEFGWGNGFFTKNKHKPIEFNPPAPQIKSCFVGDIPSDEFITGSELIKLVGLEEGVPINNDTRWLKFKDLVDGKVKYIPMLPLAHSVSYDDLNKLDLVYGKEIEIDGMRYICRLIKGLNNEYSNKPLNEIYGYDTNPTHGSEWNRLMYPICAPTGDSTWDNITDPSSPGLGAWAQYNQETDLGLLWPMKGCFASCQEHPGSLMVYRAHSGVSWVNLNTSSNASTYYGWRPCLERVD